MPNFNEKKNDTSDIKLAAKLDELKDNIEQSINRLSLENFCDTPDFLLAEMLIVQLRLYIKTQQQNKKWHNS